MIFVININSRNWFRYSRIREKFDLYARIQVFYSALEPKSIAFITDQFKAFYNRGILNEHVIDLIPISLDVKKTKSDNGNSEYKSSKGDGEIFANLISSCAIDLIGRVNSYEFLICFEENIKDTNLNYQSTKDDVKELLLSNKCPSFDKKFGEDILKCVETKKGVIISLNQDEKEDKEIHGLPFISINGEHNEDEENKVLENLISYISEVNDKLSRK